MFGFGDNDEDEYQQPQEKSFLSKVGSFLFKALTTLAVIALAIVALITFSDTARDKLDEWTKDKDGKGGLGTKIRESIGAAKEETKSLAENVTNGIKNAANSVSNFVFPPKDGSEIGAKEVAATAAGAYVAKKTYNALKGTDEVKLAKSQEQLETLKEAAEKAKSEAAELKKAADAAKEKLNERGKLDPKRLGDARELSKAKAAADKAEKVAEKLGKKITALEAKIEKDTAKIAKNGAKTPANPIVNHGSEVIDAKGGKIADVSPEGKVTPKGEAVKATSSAPSKALTTASSVITDAEVVAPAASKGGMWSSVKGFFERHPTISKLLTPLAVGVILVEGKSHASASWDNNDYGTAVVHGASTAAKTGLLIASAPIYLAGTEIIDDVTHVGKTLTDGNPSNMDKGIIASTIDDYAIKPVLDTIHGAEKAFLEKKMLDALTTEQKAIIKDLQERAKADNLNIPLVTLIKHAEGHYWQNPSSTPNTTLAAKDKNP